MTELVVVSAADEAALLAEIGRLVAFLDRVPDVPFLDVAYTCSLARGPARLAVIADDVASLRARLVSARSRIASGAQSSRILLSDDGILRQAKTSRRMCSSPVLSARSRASVSGPITST